MRTTDTVPPGSTTDPVEVALEAVVSAAAWLLGLLVLWPPGLVYWDGLAAVVGETPTLGLVIVLALGAGAWFARTAEFGFGALAAGTVLGYGVGMLALELWVTPESPVHLLWYGTVAGAGLCGAGLWRLAVQRSP